MARIKDAYERQHATNLRLIQKKIDAIYSKFTEEVAAQSQGLGVITPDEPFSLSDYPKTQRSINRLVVSLADSLNAALVSGIKASWELAEQKNDSLCKTVFGTLFDSLTPEKKLSYLQHNDDALAAFIARKSGGLNLSQNVWNIASLASGMIESTLELGIKSGQDARSIARDLKQYLKFPDKLFRRVRDNEGNLHLSKNAAMFHPGQGVYRSSYKNALRLAATETNIAYRDADHLRHQQLDFVVGIEIHLSNNHTCLNSKGVPEPFFDICDELKGKYPKDFHFNGWHPNCRCYVTTILKTKEEVLRDLDGVDRGSVNAVKEMPKEYEEWLERNADRIRGAEERGTLPYFLKNNEWTWKEDAERPLAVLVATNEPVKPTALEIAEKRHAARTPEMVAEIKDRWDTRRLNNYITDIQNLPSSDEFWNSLSPEQKKDKMLEFLSKYHGYIDPNLQRLIDSLDGDRLYQAFNNIGQKNAAYNVASMLDSLVNSIGIANVPSEYREAIFNYAKIAKQIGNDALYGKFVSNQAGGVYNVVQLMREGVDAKLVSPYMPIELLPGKGMFDKSEKILSREIFDSLQCFIPISMNPKEKRSVFNPTEQRVVLGRAVGIGKHAMRVIYHEYTHALDKVAGTFGKNSVPTGWVSQSYTPMMELIDNALKKKTGEMPSGYYDILARLEKSSKDSYRNTAIADILQAISGKDYGFSQFGGHEVSYFNNNKLSRNQELVADLRPMLYIDDQRELETIFGADVKKELFDLLNAFLQAAKIQW